MPNICVYFIFLNILMYFRRDPYANMIKFCNSYTQNQQMQSYKNFLPSDNNFFIITKTPQMTDMKFTPSLSTTFLVFSIFLELVGLISACSSTVVDTSVDLSTNGDFQTPNLGGGYRFTTEPLYGWYSLTGKIEQGRGTIYNSRWTSQVIELETDRLDTYVQTITLQQTTTLQLRISYAARQGMSLASSGMRLRWNNQQLLRVDPSVDYLIHTQTFTLTGNQGENKLYVQALGINDGGGMTADNIIFNIIQNTNRVVVNGQCSCQPGFFDNRVNTVCQSCSSVQPLCLTCSYNLNASNAYQFICLTCQTGYFVSNGACTICTAVMAACTSCNVPGTVCYSCNQTANYFLNPDYGVSSTQQCRRCSLAGCITCSSLTACTTCNNSANFFLNSSNVCQLCSLAGCTTCTSLTACTTCNNSANYFRIASNVCQLCSLPGCITCSSLTQCVSRNCSLYTYATGQLSTNLNLCTCQTKFSWDSTLLRCVIQCNQVEHALVAVANSYDSCTCPQKYLWDQTAKECVVQCHQIRNAVSQSPSAYDECICRDMYGWFPSVECIFLCGDIQYTNGLKQGTENECNCIESFIWDYTSLKCVVDCGSIPYALSLVQGSLNSCNCRENFFWSAATFCTIQCDRMDNTNGLAAGTSDQCNCKEGFIWNSTLSQCTINCTAIEYAVELRQGTLTECNCSKSYSWKAHTRTCVLACEDIEYTQQLWTLPEDIVCPCLPDFIWNITNRQCQYNCSSVQNSTGQVQQGTADVCICAVDNIWDIDQKICKPKQFDKLLASIIGMGVVSTGALFNYLYIQIKKRLASLIQVNPEPSMQVIVG